MTLKTEDFELVPISSVRLGRKNIRTTFDDDKLTELADSIRQRGVLHPITCRRANGKLELIAGERRLRAAKKAGLTQIPAIIREADDAEVAYDRIVENLQRENLSDDDQYNALKSLRDMGLTIGRISKMTGLSTTSIQRVLVLDTLKPSIRERDDISPYNKSFIAKAPEEVQDVLAKRVAEGTISSTAIGHDVMPAIRETKEEKSFSQHEKMEVIERIAREATKDRPARNILWQEKGKKKLQDSDLDVELSSKQALQDMLDSSQRFYDKLLSLQVTRFDHLDPKLVIGILTAFRKIQTTLTDILGGIEAAKERR